jgi:hypothetical protein
MTKVVVVVKGGVVQEVIADGEDVKILILDRDPVAGNEYLLADVLGEPAAFDALVQNAVTLNPQRTQQAFEETLQCVDVPHRAGLLREEPLLSLLGDETAPGMSAEMVDRLVRVFQQSKLPGLHLWREGGTGFKVFCEHLGAKRSIAAMVYEDQAWRTKVFGYTPADLTTPSIEKQLAHTEGFFAAAVQVKDFFEHDAVGDFSLR